MVVGTLGLAQQPAVGPDKASYPWKGVIPPAGAVRVRVPMTDQKTGFCHFSARLLLPRPKMAGQTATASTDESKLREVPITIAFEARPGRSLVSVQKWREWGFDVPPPGQKVTLPELVIPAIQLLPKPQRGHDVWIRLTQIALDVVDLPAGNSTILGSDLLLSISDLTRRAEHRWQPHFHLDELYLDLTVPIAQVRYSGTSELVLRQPPAPTKQAGALLPVAVSTAPKGPPLLSYLSLNGVDRYPLADGRLTPVRGVVASLLNCPGGIALSMGTARACGIEPTEHKVPGLGVNFKTTIAKARLKELRLELFVGPNYTVPRDLLLKDVDVWIDLQDSDHLVWLGPEFWRNYLTDPIYVCSPNGTWKLYGHVDPQWLADPQSRSTHLRKQ